MRNEVIIDIESLGEVALPHLWRDEIGDVFVLTKAMEIFPFSKTVLSCYCWSSKVCLQLQKTGLIYDVRKTEDNLYWFKTDRSNLHRILALGRFKRRPHFKGKWITRMEERLGHKIHPLADSQKLSLMELFKKKSQVERQEELLLKSKTVGGDE